MASLLYKSYVPLADLTALLARIHQRHYGITKHVSKLSASTPSNPNGPQLPLPPNSPIPTAHLTQKETQTISKIQSEWEKIEILQEEKVKLADRMERIVSRARERARAEWVKVGGLDIEDLEGGWEGNLGGEIVLPPSGLGSGSDRQRSKFIRRCEICVLEWWNTFDCVHHSDHIFSSILSRGYRLTSRTSPTSPPPASPILIKHRPPSIVYATPTRPYRFPPNASTTPYPTPKIISVIKEIYIKSSVG